MGPVNRFLHDKSFELLMAWCVAVIMAGAAASYRALEPWL